MREKSCKRRNAQLELIEVVAESAELEGLGCGRDTVEDLWTGAILMEGQPKGGVYEWPAVISPSANPSVRTPTIDWHHRLGHPSETIQSHVISMFQLPSSFSTRLSQCSSCLSNKSHKLPFSISTVMTNAPLQIIYSDVWTSPLISIDGYKHYVAFIDHFTHYIWLYPLKRKGDVATVFPRFKSLVEIFFHRRIITLYFDNGGEFIGLRNYLSLHGISHLTSPPHTPEHNGFIERHHRHIVETGFSLLTQASLPLTFWSYAFLTAVYLINRLPTPTLQMSSLYLKLFTSPPNYQKLRVFGCLCYPWLKPYSPHKLAPKSRPCVFLGYSLTQSAYLCYDFHSSHLYVSRHVRFLEQDFPMSRVIDHLPCVADPPPSLWLPPPVLDLPTSSTPPAESRLPGSDCSSTTTQVTLNIPSSTVPSNVQDHLSPTPAPSPLPDPSSRTSSISNPAPRVPNVRTSPIITRSRNNIFKPNLKLSLSTQLTHLIEPTTVFQAMKDSQWQRAMFDEFDALVRNGTWELVPPNSAQNVVGCKWIYKIKRHSDGSIDRYKARLVAKGFHQRPGVDYHDTFSPVVKPVTIRIVLSLAISRGWSLRQLDVNNAFLQGSLRDDVYMSQPPGFIDPDRPSHVCKLRQALYGLKQPLELGPTPSSVQDFISVLARRFSLKDIGPLHFFLGIEVVPHPRGVLLSQRRYIADLLARAKMTDASPIATPMATSPSLSLYSGTTLSDPTEYRAIIGGLQYLSLTRPDISFAVNKLSQFMHRPTLDHWAAAKRILRYLCGTIHHGILIQRDSPHELHAYSDSDWDGDKDTYCSTGAYIIYLSRNPISWTSKKQLTVARSTTEAEYRTVATTAAELCWITNLLQELGLTLTSQPAI